jgi:hypothetical protein
MRLINTKTLGLVEFFENDAPKYAILSHTWGAEEVSFPEMLGGQGTSKKGYAKIKGCCAQALLDGYAYVWIDTCCMHFGHSNIIDVCKSS